MVVRTEDKWLVEKLYRCPGPNPGLCFGLPQYPPIYKLLEHVREHDPQVQSYGISTTQGNNWISKKSPSEGSKLIVS